MKKVRDLIDGQEYAIKQILIRNDFEHQEKFLREVKLYARLESHQNIVGYKNSWIEPCSNSTENNFGQSENLSLIENFGRLKIEKSNFNRNIFSSKEFSSTSSEISSSEINSKYTIFIKMELCGISLKTYLEERNSKVSNLFELNLKKELNIFKQILFGVKFIHENNIIHRDLKPSNILFSLNEKFVKIADFGLATHLHMLQKINNNSINHHSTVTSISPTSSLTIGLGTSVYAAPEQKSKLNTDGKTEYDHRVDIYSLGIILFELVYPIHTLFEKSKHLDELKTNRRLPKDFPNNNLGELIIKMTETSFKNRPESIAHILKLLKHYMAEFRKNRNEKLVMNKKGTSISKLKMQIFRLKRQKKKRL